MSSQRRGVSVRVCEAMSEFRLEGPQPAVLTLLSHGVSAYGEPGFGIPFIYKGKYARTIKKHTYPATF